MVAEVTAVKLLVGILNLVVLVAYSLLYPFIFSFGVVTLGANVSQIGAHPRSRVDSGLKTHSVDGVHKAFDVLELLVGLNGIVFSAADALPSVVDVNVCVAVVCKAFVDHSLCRTEHLLLADALAPAVPAVPAHGGCQQNILADNDAQVTLGLTQCVLCAQGYIVCALFFENSGDDTCLLVELQSFGQSLGREGHGADTRCGYRVAELCLGAHSEYARAVDARGVGRGGRQNVL